ncbi:MAG TPA: hypothetical protein DCQ64_32395 [Candidatus Rokubacteria bacterium]|nr:hypothetical protein [Candidatus Rokubacteria bacterium]
MAGTNRRYALSTAKSWVLGESDKGQVNLAVSFPVKDAEGNERFIVWRGYFTEKTTDRTIESLRYMGFEGDDLSNLVGLDKNQVELVIEDEEYEGKTYERVQFINKAGGALTKQPLVGEKASAFAAQLKGAFRAFDAAAGKRVSTKPGAAKAAPATGPLGDEPPPLGNDDIPF